MMPGMVVVVAVRVLLLLHTARAETTAAEAGCVLYILYERSGPSPCLAYQ